VGSTWACSTYSTLFVSGHIVTFLTCCVSLQTRPFLASYQLTLDAVGFGAVCTTRCHCIGSKGTQVILMKSVSVEAVGCEQLAQSRRYAAAPWP